VPSRIGILARFWRERQIHNAFILSFFLFRVFLSLKKWSFFIFSFFLLFHFYPFKFNLSSVFVSRFFNLFFVYLSIFSLFLLILAPPGVHLFYPTIQSIFWYQSLHICANNHISFIWYKYAYTFRYDRLFVAC
jgi:hypothetical protein